MSLVSATSRLEARLARLDPVPRGLDDADYHFLLGRFIDAATLARASALAARWRVHPHEVLIANGWLDAEDYYRALAAYCGTNFRPDLPAAHVAPPGPSASPRQCLINGLLKERARPRHSVLAPERLRPAALRELLARLSPYTVSLATPHSIRTAVHRHFAGAFAHRAVEGLAARYPEQSARPRPALWQRLACGLAAGAMVCALATAPLTTIWVVTLGLAVLFVPVIALRLVAASGLMGRAAESDVASPPRQADATLPIYTILVPLYREAHMLATRSM